MQHANHVGIGAPLGAPLTKSTGDPLDGTGSALHRLWRRFYTITRVVKLQSVQSATQMAWLLTTLGSTTLGPRFKLSVAQLGFFLALDKVFRQEKEIGLNFSINPASLILVWFLCLMLHDASSPLFVAQLPDDQIWQSCLWSFSFAMSATCKENGRDLRTSKQQEIEVQLFNSARGKTCKTWCWA
jgi:hypothetical protein